MKIASVRAYSYDVAYTHGDYGMSHGRSAVSQRSLVVRVNTEDGHEGWGETCPHGATYLPAFFEGEREALRLLGTAVLGLDPRDLGRVNARMDAALLSGQAAKSALDAACWDVLGKSAGLPVAQLLGGVLVDAAPAFLAVPVGSPAGMAEYARQETERGLTCLQVKVGDDVDDDVARLRAVCEAVGPNVRVWADANGGWALESALLFAHRVADLPVAALEQPCRSLQDCGEVARRTSIPLIVDECVNSVQDLVLARQLGASGVNVKMGRVGGLTKARTIRDTAQALGMRVAVDDAWGGSIVTAQNLHLAVSTQPEHLVAVSLFSDWTTPTVSAAPRMGPSGRVDAPIAPGLVSDVDVELLGAPLIAV